MRVTEQYSTCTLHCQWAQPIDNTSPVCSKQWLWFCYCDWISNHSSKTKIVLNSSGLVRMYTLLLVAQLVPIWVNVHTFPAFQCCKQGMGLGTSLNIQCWSYWHTNINTALFPFRFPLATLKKRARNEPGDQGGGAQGFPTPEIDFPSLEFLFLMYTQRIGTGTCLMKNQQLINPVLIPVYNVPTPLHSLGHTNILCQWYSLTKSPDLSQLLCLGG